MRRRSPHGTIAVTERYGTMGEDLMERERGDSRAEFATDRLRIEREIVITTQGTRAGERIAGLVRLSSGEGVVIRLQS